MLKETYVGNVINFIRRLLLKKRVSKRYGKHFIKTIGFAYKEAYPQCKNCSHFFADKCEGMKWFPFKTKPCEFFRDKDLLCIHAIPYIQEDGFTRNNHCSLDVKQRDSSEDVSRGQDWNCPLAHTKLVEYYKCYKAIKEEL